MVAPEWVVQHPTLPESKMLPVAPMGSLDVIFTPAPLAPKSHDQSPWRSSSARKIGHLYNHKTLGRLAYAGQTEPRLPVTVVADQGSMRTDTVVADTPLRQDVISIVVPTCLRPTR